MLLYSLIPIFFLYIPASAAEAAVDPKGINTLLANGLITFDIQCNPVFSKGASNLPKNPPDCIIFDNWVFDNLILADELFAKALRRFETCVLINNNLLGKLFSLSPIILDDNLKTEAVSFFITDLNLLSYKFDNFTFKLLYWVILF